MTSGNGQVNAEKGDKCFKCPKYPYCSFLFSMRMMKMFMDVTVNKCEGALDAEAGLS